MRRGETERNPGRNGTRWAAKLTILHTGREGADRRESVALVSPHRATFRKVVFLSESANPPSPFLKGAKGNFETQRLGTLSGACRDASCTFLFSSPFPLSPHGSSIGWLQPLRLGLHSRQGPGALTHRGTWMDGWDGDGLGQGLGRECWSSVGAVEVVTVVLFVGLTTLVGHLAVSLISPLPSFPLAYALPRTLLPQTFPHP